LARGGSTKQGSEDAMPDAPTIEAEDEFLEVGLQVLTAQPMIGAQGPDLEVAKDPVHPGQDNMGADLADDVRIVVDADGAGVS